MPIKAKEKGHQRVRKTIKELCLMDDDFMTACFDQDIESTRLVLSIIFNDPNIRIKSVQTQKRMKNLLGRDICLDIHAIDGEDQEINVEVQRADEGASPKRARYHSSIMDAHSLKENQSFDSLPESYVIFITENDVFKSDKPIYHIERHITDTGELFSDGEHIIYVNGANGDINTELGKLVHDFKCKNAEDMFFSQLADKVRYFKETEKGVSTMSGILKEMREEAYAEGRSEGRLEGRSEGKSEGQTIIVENMLKKDKTINEIVDLCNLPEDFVREVEKKMRVTT